MNIAYFQCNAGASGDMILGALIDAGLSLERLREYLCALPFGGYELTAQKVMRKGIAATKVEVTVKEDETPRSLKDIEAIIHASNLPNPVREKCLQIFWRLATAEAQVHGKTIDEITFHEVGAKDAIIDIVGAVVGFSHLGIEEIYSSPLNVGSGIIETPTGFLPVPAPATLVLLKGIPVYSRYAERELLTPTGAAILSTLSKSFGDMPLLKVKTMGYGAGSYDLSIPNVLRIIVGEKEDRERDFLEAPALMMETNIDDMNPEWYDHIMRKLFALGAMDVFIKPIQMKKNRPAATLSVLLRREDFPHLRDTIFAETTTLGIRCYEVTKYMLPYEIINVSTPWGEIPVKVGKRGNRICLVAPEYEVCLRVAEKLNLPLKEIYDLTRFAAYDQLKIVPPGEQNKRKEEEK